MLDFLHRHVLLPAYEGGLKRRNTFRYWRQLEGSQWLAPVELEQRQLQALKRLIEHAYTNCPYYTEAWLNQGLEPRKLQKRRDFEQWPVIDRSVISAHRFQMRARTSALRLIHKSTGGSAGVPLHFDLDHDSHDRRTAAWLRGYRWAGAEPGRKELYLWGVPLGARPWWKRSKDRLYHWLYRRRVLNSFELSEASVPMFLERLNRFRAPTIIAYTGALYAFARALASQRLRPFSPRAIIVGAEKLYPFQRATIEEVFEAPVFETYGSREFMLIGAECERHEGLHLTVEHLLVEVLDDDGQPTPEGEEGNVVITDLYNYGMPFIRYANGDRAVAGWKNCSCGRGLPLLRKVVGRRLDVIRTPDGRLVPGEFFPHLVKDYPAIRRFQVAQQRTDYVQLRAVLNEEWNEASRRSLELEIRQVLGPAVHFEFVPVDDIPLTAAGKHRVVVAQ
jgi:phenylacetate-coenzyme A ligase PaaK-like adenylate-forming protein